ncbi:MAG: hypothetical protein JKY56_21670 [Kofleriaceae bacterium]|nr:hypothetical protein [Kofleriaceae bacterium]
MQSRGANDCVGRRDGERGSILLIALLVLTGLLALAALSVVKVSRGAKSNSQTRFRSVALFAAESGISAGMDFLRNNTAPLTYYSAFVSPSNTSVQTPLGIAGNTIAAGDPGSVFGASSHMSYTVSVKNNTDDPNFSTGSDSDGIVILHSVGEGPDLSRVQIEVRVQKIVGVASLKVLGWHVLD